MTALLVFDSHPVQYRTPIWQAINRIAPDSIHVAYATICSVEGYHDQGFGEKIAWDEPLLEGYRYTNLEAENGKAFSGWKSLTGKGVKAIIKRVQPKAILLTGLNYQFDQVALWEARRAGIPVHLRCENQDRAFPRAKWKSLVRAVYYKQIYTLIDRFYYIGQLNKAHYLSHGVSEGQLFPAHYFTLDRFADLSSIQKTAARTHTRASQQIRKEDYVIGFSGKFIAKKNPTLLFEMLDYFPSELRARTVLYFMGSGALQAELEVLGKDYKARYGVRTVFTGFVNQSEIAPHYLAMDMLILPSRQMGETWGLVVNEAMQAGCSAIVSNFVGSSEDFKAWERFEVFKDADAQDLAQKVSRLASYERDFDWAKETLKAYSLDACVQEIIAPFQKRKKITPLPTSGAKNTKSHI